MSQKKDTQKPTKSTAATDKKPDGFSDEGAVWPVAFALKELTAAEETMISELVKKAVR